MKAEWSERSTGGDSSGHHSSLDPELQYYTDYDNLTRGEDDMSLVVITNEINTPIVIVAYSLILIVSLVGNTLVCHISFSGRKCPGRSHRSRTTTDLLIGCLAFSDLVMTIFNIPFNIARILLPHWPFGSFLCFGVPFVQTACVYVSTFTMTAIALHRWRTVTTRDNHFAYSNQRLILTVWLLSTLFALPTIAFNTLKEVNVNGEVVIRCRVQYPASLEFNIPLFLTMAVFLTQYLVPLMITGVLYAKIARVVTMQGRIASVVDDDRKRRRQFEAKRRIIMLALVVAVFALCWLPINLYHLTIDLGLAQNRLSVFVFCHWFAMSSVCYNSLIYCWLNARFRQNAKDSLGYVLFEWLCCHRKADAGAASGTPGGERSRKHNRKSVLTTANSLTVGIDPTAVVDDDVFDDDDEDRDDDDELDENLNETVNVTIKYSSVGNHINNAIELKPCNLNHAAEPDVGLVCSEATNQSTSVNRPNDRNID